MKIYSAELVCSAPDPSRFPRDDLPEIAFIGRSNVGKSSLINSLLGQRRLARTSSTPGRTRLINFFRISGRFYFVDCPGYGYAKVSKDLRRQWARLLDSYLGRRENLAVCVLIIDSRIGPTEQDLQTIVRLQLLSLPFFMISTKADRLSASELKKSLRHTESLAAGAAVVAYSATRRIGCDKVWALLSRHIQATAQP